MEENKMKLKKTSIEALSIVYMNGFKAGLAMGLGQYAFEEKKVEVKRKPGRPRKHE